MIRYKLIISALAFSLLNLPNYSFSQIKLDSGLVAFYPFHGNASDFSGNGRHCNVSNATLTTDRFNRSNRAYDFNGTSSVIYGTADSAGFASKNVSYSAWIKPNAANLSGNRRIFAVGPTNSSWSHYTSWIEQTSGKFGFYAGPSGTPSAYTMLDYSNGAISAGNWVNITVTVDSMSALKFYINGQLNATRNGNVVNNGTNFSGAGSSTLTIGGTGYPSLVSLFSGVMDDIRFYNRVLTPNEITALYNASPLDSVKWIKSTPFRGISAGGTAINPDKVCKKDTVTYTLNPPDGLPNNGYGSLWFIKGSPTLKTIGGQAAHNNSWTFTYPNSTNPALFSFTPGPTEHDSIYKLSMIVRDSVIHKEMSIDYYIKVSGLPPQVQLGNDTIVCPGRIVKLQATPGMYAYQWSNNSTADSLRIGLPGVYWVKVLTADNCFSTDTFQLNNFNTKKVNLGSDKVFCPGLTFIQPINPGTFNSYLWNTSSTQSSIPVTSSGTYWVNTSDSNGCHSSDTVAIEVRVQQINLGNDIYVCPGESTSISAGNFNSYTWNTNATSSSINVSSTGNYWVEVTDSNGCPSRDTIALYNFFVKSVNLGPDIIVCPGDSFTIQAGPFNSYLWSTSASTSSIVVKVPGMYWTKVQDSNLCESRDTILFSNHTTNLVSLGSDTSICYGQNLTLNAGSYSSYLWNDNSNGSSLNVSQAGLYWVKVSDANACDSRDSVYISTIPLPASNFSYTNTSGTRTYSFSPTDTNQASYKWLWGDNNSSNVKNPVYTYASNGTYNVKLIVSNQAGCKDSSTQIVSVNLTIGISSILSNTLDITLYPNPSYGSIEISAATTFKGLNIYDFMGKEVHSTSMEAPADYLKVDISALANGIYVVYITTEAGKRIAGKLVKE